MMADPARSGCKQLRERVQEFLGEWLETNGYHLAESRDLSAMDLSILVYRNPFFSLKFTRDRGYIACHIGGPEAGLDQIAWFDLHAIHRYLHLPETGPHVYRFATSVPRQSAPPCAILFDRILADLISYYEEAGTFLREHPSLAQLPYPSRNYLQRYEEETTRRVQAYNRWAADLPPLKLEKEEKMPPAVNALLKLIEPALGEWLTSEGFHLAAASDTWTEQEALLVYASPDLRLKFQTMMAEGYEEEETPLLLCLIGDNYAQPAWEEDPAQPIEHWRYPDQALAELAPDALPLKPACPDPAQPLPQQINALLPILQAVLPLVRTALGEDGEFAHRPQPRSREN